LFAIVLFTMRHGAWLPAVDARRGDGVVHPVVAEQDAARVAVADVERGEQSTAARARRLQVAHLETFDRERAVRQIARVAAELESQRNERTVLRLTVEDRVRRGGVRAGGDLPLLAIRAGHETAEQRDVLLRRERVDPSRRRHDVGALLDVDLGAHTAVRGGSERVGQARAVVVRDARGGERERAFAERRGRESEADRGDAGNLVHR
jgi:hypothetical protein